MKINNMAKKFISLMLALILTLAVIPASVGAAQKAEKTVRVGWYESPFNTTDEFGRRSGYAYEYQQKMAAYTGWKYEYIEGSWSNLLQMLIDGKIDILSDVSYTEERAEKMLFSSLPMGAAEYYLYTTPDNNDITVEDYSTFNGKKVGVYENSVQADLFRQWAKDNNVHAKLIELDGTEESNTQLLISGKIDMYLTLDAVADIESTIPICKVGSSDFYFAVNKNRSDLLAQVNAAMSRIQDDNRFYHQQLYSKYLKSTVYNRFLSNEEEQWLEKHGKIRVGYQDNYLAFCAKDPKTGELIGALSDYLKAASKCLENAEPQFEAVCFPTAEEALKALEAGKIDCMFPANMTDYYGEESGFFMSTPIMTTDMLIIVNEEAQATFFNKERVTVAVNAGNPNYDMFLLDHYPQWRPLYFDDTAQCLKAIADGKADCLFISNFRYNNLSKQCEKYHLTALSSGVEMEYCFAVRSGNPMLYSILNKISGVIPDSTMTTALSHYYTEDAKAGILDVIAQNWLIISLVLLGIVFVILFLIWRSAKEQKKASTSQKLILATQTDDLTGLYNKDYFFEYANRSFLSEPDKPMDAVVINIEQFHSVNAINGRAFGDRVLHELSDEIHSFTDEVGGIAGHIQADRFAVYCPHMEDCRVLYDRLQGKLDTLSTHAPIHLRMGVTPWEKDTDPEQMVEQALIACNLARGLYMERLIVFDEAMSKKEAFRQRLLNDLHDAIENQELEVYYQPKFDIQCEPPKLQGAEALVRWNHPEYGVIAPDEFISLFESNGQIGEIDKYVWQQAAAQVALWRERYGVVLPVSVNLSRVDVFDPMLEVTLETLLEDNGLTHNAFELEITESAFIENEQQLFEIIEELRGKGFKIAMDDFGAGYSSLNALSAMPIDAIKMDSAFIKDIKLNRRGVQFVELILNIAENLKVPVVAEGVETEAQLQLLKNMGCELVQGFYFSKPIPPAEFEEKYFRKN